MSNGNISLCPGDANVSWLGDVSNTYRMVTFIPPPKSGLPNLSYHSSEKSYQLGFRWLQAFSLGLDNPNPMVMHLSWDGAMHCKNRSNVTLYLQTLQSVLVMAGQRASVVPLASPLWSVDGALLLNGSHAWNSISSTWVQYQASSGWVLFMSLFVVCCLFLFISTVQWAYYTFMDDLVDKIMAWLAQCPSHPKLDDLRSLQRRIIIKVSDSSQTASTTGTRSATSGSAGTEPTATAMTDPSFSLAELMQRLSPFFILDNLISNAYKCEESLKDGCLSSLLGGLIFGVVPAQVGILVFFVPSLQPVFSGMIIVYGVFITVHATLHFSALNLGGSLQRTMNSLTSALLLIWLFLSGCYFCTCVIYLVCVAAENPTETAGIVLNIMTIIFYIPLLINQEKAQHLKFKQTLSGKASAGVIASELKSLGASIEGIIFNVVLDVCFLVCLLLLIVVLTGITSGATSWSVSVQAVVVPTAAILKAVGSAQTQANSLNSSASNILSKVETIA